MLTMSNLFISALRAQIPNRIRMIVEVAIIATFVILLDQFIKAFYGDMSQRLGPYVALIITNCIVMGRAEAFATQNPPLPSIVDGFANGIGYALILLIIGFFRELIGSIFTNNILFASFLGMCSFLVCSNRISTALGFGSAVTFVNNSVKGGYQYWRIICRKYSLSTMT